MSLLNRLRPKWQNSDPDVRADAVRQLDKGDIELLTAVAQQDEDARVRRVAIKKLDAPRLLLEIAETDEDSGVRSYARDRARQLLIQIACDARDADESTRALGLLTDPSDIACVAEKAHFEEIRSSAFAALRNDEALAGLVRRTRDSKLRAQALEKIVDPAALRSIVVDEAVGEHALAALARLDDLESLEAIVDQSTAPRGIRRHALAKLSKLVPEDHPLKVKERHEQLSELCAKVEALAESTDADVPERLASIEASLAELTARGAPAPNLIERYRSAAARIRERYRRSSARTHQAPGGPPSKADPSSLDARRTLLIERIEKLDFKLADSRESETLENLEAEWRALETEPGEESARHFKAAVEKARLRIEALSERRQELDRFLKEAESVASTEPLARLSKAWQKLERSWRRLGVSADGERKARFTRAALLVTERRDKARLEREALEQTTLTEIQAHLKRMATLCESPVVSIKDGDKELRQAQDLLKNMGPLPSSVNRKKIRRELSEAREKLFKKTQDTRALEEWKRWANVDIQEGLIRRVEALREVHDTPKVAKELREIHEEWKRAGSAPAERAEELWRRYKSVRDELKARCDEFFKKQKKERAENLATKQALAAQVEALQDSEDWNQTAELIKELQAQWKKTGPVPQKQSEAVWKRFRKACDHFFDRRKAHFGEIKDEREDNYKKKEALCVEAESIQESTDWRDSVSTFKRLQAEWRTIGPVPRKKSDQVWKRFRAACDYFFDRYKRRDEVEAEQRLEQRETVIRKARELASEGPPEPTAFREQLETLWSEWKKLGQTPESKRELQEAFEKHVAELVARAPETFKNTELDPAVSRKKREKLVTRLEALVDELHGRSPAAERSGNDLEDLAARLKDALASNTMTGGAGREPKPDPRTKTAEVRRLRGSWLRIAPVPGDEGRALTERFENAYRSFFERKRRPRG